MPGLIALSLTALSALFLSPAAWLGAPRPPGVSLDVQVEGAEVGSTGRLDLRFDHDALRGRLDLSGGPRAGQSMVVVLSRVESADRYYAYRPALGVSPLRAAQAERLLMEVGFGIQDVVQLLYPGRSEGAEGWTAEASVLLAPADEAGCRDRFVFEDDALPAQISLCAAEPWGAREIRVSEPFELDGHALPGRFEVSHADGRVVTVRLSPSEQILWKDEARFTREGLGAQQGG